MQKVIKLEIGWVVGGLIHWALSEMIDSQSQASADTSFSNVDFSFLKPSTCRELEMILSERHKRSYILASYSDSLDSYSTLNPYHWAAGCISVPLAKDEPLDLCHWNVSLTFSVLDIFKPLPQRLLREDISQSIFLSHGTHDLGWAKLTCLPWQGKVQILAQFPMMCCGMLQGSSQCWAACDLTGIYYHLLAPLSFQCLTQTSSHVAALRQTNSDVIPGNAWLASTK